MAFPGPNDKYPFEERQHINDLVVNADEFLQPSPHDVYPTESRNRYRRHHLCQDGDFCISLPVARAIVQLFGNRVMGQGIVIDCEQEDAEEWLLENLRSTNFNIEMTSALEMTSAYGGAYIQVIPADNPYSKTYKPNMVSPTWLAGQLNEATLVTPLGYGEDGETEYRLYEHHSLDPTIGVEIDYILYKSKDYNLAGRPADADELMMFPEMSQIITLPRVEGMNFPVFRRVIPGVDALDIKYVPNILPNYDMLLPHEGRSDIAPLFDMLRFLDLVLSATADATYKGKMTIFVKEELLESHLGRQFFTRYNNLLVPVTGGPVDMGNSDGIHQVQFQLQVTERMQVASNLKSFIYEQAGVSPQSLGINVAGINESGIAKEVRERTTKDSVQRKRQSATEPLRRILDMMLTLGGYSDVGIDIRFPSQNILTDKELAETAKVMLEAGIIDRAGAIEYVFPNLTQKEIKRRADAAEDLVMRMQTSGVDPTSSAPPQPRDSEVGNRPGEPRRA